MIPKEQQNAQQEQAVLPLLINNIKYTGFPELINPKTLLFTKSLSPSLAEAKINPTEFAVGSS